MRRALALVSVLAPACGRSGYEGRVPGLGNVDGLLVSEPGGLVPEENRYDITPALDGEGYALSWVEYPVADRTPTLKAAVVDEDGELVVEPVVLEILTGLPSFVRIATGPEGYVVFHEMPDGTHVALALDAALVTRSRDDTGPSGGHFAVAPVPDGFATLFVKDSGLKVQMLDGRGVPRGLTNTVDALIAMGPETPHALWTGDALFVTWTDVRAGGRRVWFARLDLGGSQLVGGAMLFDDGQTQANVFVLDDGQGGVLVTWDGQSVFPQYVLRADAAGAPIWPAPGVLFTYPWYHQTVEPAAGAGRLAGAWINETPPSLGYPEFAVMDATGTSAPAQPPARELGDPKYGYCYPEMARASRSFGSIFVGEVEGSAGLFFAVVPD